MTKIIDLRPDKHLLNPKFEKYQFCSDFIPIKYEKELQTEILHLEPNPSQDSWLEARLFAFHNHLFKNPYDSTCWFIDNSKGIWKYEDNGSLNLIFTSKKSTAEPSQYIYNPTIAFASKNILIFCDGGGTFEILIENNEGIKNLLIEDYEPAVILDARYVKESSSIIVALHRIDENHGKRFSKLIFLFYNYQENVEDQSQSLKLIQKQILKVKGAIEQVYIENNGKFCHVISQDQIEFEYDSINPVKTKDNNSSNDSKIKVPKYYWSQDEDSITIIIRVPENYSDGAAKIETTFNTVSILINDTILLSGETSNRLEADLTTWKRKDNTLEVELSKSESGLMWNELIKGDTEGEHLLNETLAAEIHSRLSHLCSNEKELKEQIQPAIGFNADQLEECDLTGAENIIQRINFNTHTITDMIMLGSSNRILFTEKQASGQVLCLRHDHDGCIWLMKESDTENWDIKHTHTFPGFGYVEASKTNKKFCLSPPDGSFITIIEHNRHAFLYDKPGNDAEIGKQRILDFGSEISSILGAVIVNKYLIILTKTTLYQLEVYS